MSLREKFRELKGGIKKKARAALGQVSPTRSTSSLPDVASLNNNPLPESHTPRTLSPSPSLAPRPVSTPPETGRAVIDGTWTYLKAFLGMLDQSAGIFGPLKAVMDELVQCIEIHEEAAARWKDYEVLKMQLEALFKDLSSHFSENVPPTMTASMENLCLAIKNELHHLSSKQDGSTWTRHLESKQDLDDVLECYRRIQGHLERLKLNADLSIWKTVDEHATEARLKQLAPATSARYNSAEAIMVRRRECTPKTREQVLKELMFWRRDRAGGKIFWMSGMAGTGKTTIATSLCAKLNREHELGASFFCTRLLPECRNINLVLPTIAYQLARFSIPFRSALSRVLQRDPDVHTQALQNQFEDMIVGPLREVAPTLPADIVVVIDALDECEDGEGAGQMLEVLLTHASELPIKFFLSSRPETHIRRRIWNTQSRLILHELDERMVKEDIETYLRVELARISLSESQLAALVERAGVLFIYAATVVRYVGAGDFSLDPKKRLETVLGVSTSTLSNKNKEIDALYTAVLTSAFENPDLEHSDKEQMKLVLHSVICAQEPLTVNALAGLLQLNDADRVHAALQPLWSVLHVSGASGLVTTLHASFPDHMLDPKRSNEYGCNIEAHNDRLAELCFERIKSNERQFNICELKSSYVFDQQIPDLEERVKRAIPLDLFYACQYWATHLELGGSSNIQAQFFLEFLSKRLLLWMEVLNLKKRMDIGVRLLEQARRWCTSAAHSQEIQELVHDAWRFVTMFAAHPVSRCTPHIYVSMLASWPRSQPVADHYIQRTTGLVDISGTGVARRQSALLSMFPVGSCVQCVTFSPDGTHVVTGSDDKAIRVWDIQSGQIVVGPLEGHTDSVYSVAFSPDGMHIVSGSGDTTICVWDAQNGQRTAGPFIGHTDSVNSVAFSPDGTHIVSGSTDTTIRVWDAQTGRMAIDPLEGHTDWVSSVGFSPDGTRIVSSSGDKTIRVWDAQSGRMIVDPFKGHTDEINSVAFSPDGTRIVSGSADKTLCIWDAESGRMVVDPLKGHADSVNSVAFSPDGTRVISASDDSTIHLWDAQSGQSAVVPLEGHTDWVNSVAFSPNGTRIVSGSADKTIHVWDAQSGGMALNPLEGHSDWVHSVAFSPDGMLIASGSNDHSIRVWDASSRQPVVSLFAGHDVSASSVAFSPDSTCIVSGLDDNSILIWHMQDKHRGLVRLEGHTNEVDSVAVSPDGTRIASGSTDKTVCIWDAESGQMIVGPLEGHTGVVNSVAFSPDSTRIISGSEDQTICVWDAKSGQLIARLLEGHTDWVNSVAFSPDGTRIVSGSSDKTIRVWDAESGKTVVGFDAHAGAVETVKFSPDGMYIASGSEDKTICIWDVESGRMVVGPLKGHTAMINSIAFSPDGAFIVSGSADDAIRVWDTQLRHAPTDPAPSQAIIAESTNPTDDVHAPRWVLDDSGWVLDSQSHLLLWLPPDLRSILFWPQTVAVISRRGSVHLDFSDSRIGELWEGCYAPS